jgi:hypothetical protein
MKSNKVGSTIKATSVFALAAALSVALVSKGFAQMSMPGMGGSSSSSSSSSSGHSSTSGHHGGGGIGGGALIGIGIGVGTAIGSGVASQPGPDAAEKKQLKTKESRKQARAPAPKTALATHPQAAPDCVELLLAAAGGEISEADRTRVIKLADAGGTQGGAPKILSVNTILSNLAEECQAVMLIQSTKPSFQWAIELVRSSEAVAKPLCIKEKTESGGDAVGFINVDELTDEQLAVVLHNCDNTVETMTYRHPISQAKVRVLGQRNSAGKLVPIVTDVDLLALGIKLDKPIRCDHDDSSPVREDGMGRATEPERRLLSLLNALFGATLVQHGPANRGAAWDENAAEIKYPIYMFDPDGQGQNRSIEKGPEGDEDKFLKQFVNELADRGYWIAVHPLWKQKGWKCNDDGHWAKLLRNQLGRRSQPNINLASQVPDELLSSADEVIE